MIVSTPAFLRADNFEEVIVSAVSMIFGFGMGPPDSRLNQSHAQKKSDHRCCSLIPPQYPEAASRPFEKARVCKHVGPRIHDDHRKTLARSSATLGGACSRLAPPSYTTSWDRTQRGQEFSSSDVACHVTLRLGVIHAMEGLYHKR